MRAVSAPGRVYTRGETGTRIQPLSDNVSLNHTKKANKPKCSLIEIEFDILGQTPPLRLAN